MLWQYTVTAGSYQRILQAEQEGFSRNSSGVRRVLRVFVMIGVLFLIFLLCFDFLSSLKTKIFSPASLLNYLSGLLFLCSFLYWLFTDKNPLYLFQGPRRILGSCQVRVENGWFYFLRSFSNGEYSFIRKPLRALTRVYPQNRGILIEFSNSVRFFLPKEAFSFCSVQESQRFLQEECLAALEAQALGEPDAAPFPNMRHIAEPALHSCSYLIPYQDRGTIYLECQNAVRRHLFFYLNADNLLFILCILYIACISIEAELEAGLLLAALMLLRSYIFYPFLLLPHLVRKMVKDHTFYALSEPCKISLYRSFLTESTGDSILIKPYSLVKGLYTTPNSCCIATKSPVFLFCIPRKAFESSKEEALFEDFVWSALEEDKFWEK